MTASRCEDKQICSISRVSFLSESPTPNGLPKHSLSWLTRQLDLELIVTSIISLRTTNWIKWERLFTDLLALSSGSTYSLALFIRFGGFIYRMYLLALFSGFIYSLAVFIRLGGSDHWIYLLDLFIGFIYQIWCFYLLALFMDFSFSVYSFHPHSKPSQFFSHLRKEHLYISLNIHISSSHGKNLPLSITSLLVLN